MWITFRATIGKLFRRRRLRRVDAGSSFQNARLSAMDDDDDDDDDVDATTTLLVLLLFVLCIFSGGVQRRRRRFFPCCAKVSVIRARKMGTSSVKSIF